MPESRKVIIVGGGVAGLTAAHELKERGFQVTVYERQSKFGGKARSRVVLDRTGDIANLPAEHGFRFFPGFYRHLIDTLARIPLPTGRHVVDNLVEVPKCAIAQADKPFCLFPTKGPNGMLSGMQFLRNMFASPGLGLDPIEAGIAAALLAKAMTTCDERREAELDDVAWWDYMCADDMSDDYRRVVINGLTRNFVALSAKATSMRTAVTILARLLHDFVSGSGLDRILNGPTSEVWIDPWVEYLRSEQPGQFPVSLLPDKVADSFCFDQNSGRICGLKMVDSEPVLDPEAIYVAAVPVEAMILLLQNSPGAMLQHSPTLKLLSKKHLQVSWMSGVMVYLKSDVPMAPGHIIYLDSNWAITSISQNQFWTKKVSDYGNGKVHGIVSTIISDWLTSGNGGVFSEPAQDCDNRGQVEKEALAEIRLGVRKQSGIDLSDDNIAGFYLDSDITFDKSILRSISGVMPAIDFAEASKKLHRTPFLVKANLEPLFVNTVGSWAYRPTASTDLENLLLASDYVRTNTDLATMEGANEAGRRAVNGILDLCGMPGQRCRIFEFAEPLMFAPLKALDKVCFRLGLPHP